MDQVCGWFASLNLGKDYSSLLKENLIGGDVLTTMSMEDFRSIGITAFGDLRRIQLKLDEQNKKWNAVCEQRLIMS